MHGLFAVGIDNGERVGFSACGALRRRDLPDDNACDDEHNEHDGRNNERLLVFDFG